MVENLTNFSYDGLSELEIKRQNFPRWGHTLFAVFLLIVEVFGIIENSLVLLTFFKSKQLRSATNIFVIGLCIADLCMLILGCPFSLISAFNGRWVFGDDICTLSGFIVYFFGLTQLYLLLAISVDRYIVITKPLKSALITKRVATLSCVGCFAGGLFWAILPLAGWSQYGLEAPGVFCGLDIEDTHYSFHVVIFFSCFLFPFAIMVYCYYGIYATIRNMNKTMVWDIRSRTARRNLKREKKIMKSCILMCCAFWTCWFPYAIVFFWQVLFGVDSIPLVFAEIPALAAKSQGVFNPLIYGAGNKMFRDAFYKCLPCAGMSKLLANRDEKDPTSSETEGDDERTGSRTGSGTGSRTGSRTGSNNANSAKNVTAVVPVKSTAQNVTEC